MATPSLDAVARDKSSQRLQTQGSHGSKASGLSKKSRGEQQRREYLKLDLPYVKSTKKCEDGLMEFWNWHVVGFQMEKIHGMLVENARAADSQKTCMFVLSDPRCALRPMPMPTDPNIYPGIFDETAKSQAQGESVKKVYRLHVRLMRFIFTELQSFPHLTAAKFAEERRPAWVPLSQPLPEASSPHPGQQFGSPEGSKMNPRHSSRHSTRHGRPQQDMSQELGVSFDRSLEARAHANVTREQPAIQRFILKDIDNSQSKDELEALERQEIREVSLEQQRRAAALVERHLGSGFLLNEYEKLMSHPSISFLYGWVCYKAGSPEHLLMAIPLLMDAARHPLLGPSVLLLIALCRFHVIQAADMGIGHKFVKANLKAGLDMAKEVRREDQSVEIPLLVEANAALALLHMKAHYSSRPEYAGQNSEVQKLRATKHCTEALRLYRIWVGTKVASRLLTRASKLCGMEIPGNWDWAQKHQVLSGISLKWQRRRRHPPSIVASEMTSMADGRGNKKTQVAIYESCAVVLPQPEPKFEAKIEEEAEVWHNDQEGYPWLGDKDGVTDYCQVCGGKGADIICSRCNLVHYCSTMCQYYDRGSGAHPTFCFRDTSQDVPIFSNTPEP